MIGLELRGPSYSRIEDIMASSSGSDGQSRYVKQKHEHEHHHEHEQKYEHM